MKLPSNRRFKRYPKNIEGFKANMECWLNYGYFGNYYHHDNDLDSYLSEHYGYNKYNVIDESMDIYEWFEITCNGIVLRIYPKRKRKWVVERPLLVRETNLPVWRIWKLIWDLRVNGTKVLRDYGL